MFYLFTGSPGSSKSLNCIKYICETEQFKYRPVYYYNIKEVDLYYLEKTEDGEEVERPWIELSEEQVNKWYELPDHSVIFIDECQRVFRPRRRGDAVPQKVVELETHRHRGFDLIMSTQDTSLIDSALLPQVERHTHIERRNQSEKANHFIWEKGVKNVNAQADRRKALVTTVPFDKKYYGKYKSATFHTPKNNMPLKLKLIYAGVFIVPILFILWAGSIYMGARGGSEPEDFPKSIPLSESHQTNEGKVHLFRGSDQQEQPQLSYEEMHAPRLSGLPWTAPVYDDINTPKTAPKPDACVHFKQRDLCVCYTHQATKIGVPDSICRAIVKNGYFDETREREPFGLSGASVSERAPTQPNGDARKPIKKAVLIAHTPRPRTQF